jgi:hypothetical protein
MANPKALPRGDVMLHILIIIVFKGLTPNWSTYTGTYIWKKFLVRPNKNRIVYSTNLCDVNKKEKKIAQLDNSVTDVNNFLLSLVNNTIYIKVPRILPVEVILLKVANSLSLKFKSL